MENAEYGQSALVSQSRQQLEDVDLMVDVEVRRRLIQQQDVRVLGQRARDVDPLLLAARQVGHEAPGQVGRVRRTETVVNHGPVASTLPLPTAQVGRAPHEHGLEHGEVEQLVPPLGHHRDGAGQLAPRVGLERAAVDRHMALPQGNDTGEGSHQGALAAAIRPEHSEELARAQLQVQPSEHVVTVVAGAQPARFDGQPHSSPSLPGTGSGTSHRRPGRT